MQSKKQKRLDAVIKERSDLMKRRKIVDGEVSDLEGALSRKRLELWRIESKIWELFGEIAGLGFEENLKRSDGEPALRAEKEKGERDG